MPNMQVLGPYYVKNHMKSMLHWQMCGYISLKFELNESIDYAFISYIFYCYFALNQNVVVQ